MNIITEILSLLVDNPIELVLSAILIYFAYIAINMIFNLAFDQISGWVRPSYQKDKDAKIKRFIHKMILDQLNAVIAFCSSCIRSYVLVQDGNKMRIKFAADSSFYSLDYLEGIDSYIISELHSSKELNPLMSRYGAVSVATKKLKLNSTYYIIYESSKEVEDLEYIKVIQESFSVLEVLIKISDTFWGSYDEETDKEIS